MLVGQVSWGRERENYTNLTSSLWVVKRIEKGKKTTCQYFFSHSFASPQTPVRTDEVQAGHTHGFFQTFVSEERDIAE